MKFYRYGQDVPLQFTALDAENLHYLAAFDCGDENINCLIQQDALVKRTVGYLFLNVETDEVVAYCSLACTGIVEQITNFSSVSYPKTRSAIEIDYFAVAKRYQSLKMSEEPESETLSAMILHYCIIHAKEIAQSTVGAEMIVLYSVPRACHFYKTIDEQIRKNAQKPRFRCSLWVIKNAINCDLRLNSFLFSMCLVQFSLFAHL